MPFSPSGSVLATEQPPCEYCAVSLTLHIDCTKNFSFHFIFISLLQFAMIRGKLLQVITLLHSRLVA